MSPALLEQIARQLPEDALYEVVDGRVVEKPVSGLALWIASRFQSLFGLKVEQLQLGQFLVEMIFILDEERNLRRRPDIAFVSADRWPLNQPLPYEGDWAVVPELAVEIVSPGNSANELSRKRNEYFQYGVREVWIIFPEERQVEVWSSTGCRVVPHTEPLTTELLPGLSIDLRSLLPVIEPPTPTA